MNYIYQYSNEYNIYTRIGHDYGLMIFDYTVQFSRLVTFSKITGTILCRIFVYYINPLLNVIIQDLPNTQRI